MGEVMRILLVLLSFYSISLEAHTSSEVDCESVSVIVPFDDGIGYGTMLTKKNVQIRVICKDELPEGYILPKEFEAVEGKTINRFIDGGVVIRRVDIVDFSMQKEMDYLSKKIKAINEIRTNLQKCTVRCEDSYKNQIDKLKI